jgi:hypothetical protein
MGRQTREPEGAASRGRLSPFGRLPGAYNASGYWGGAGTADEW